jgi:hypothetical protein
MIDCASHVDSKLLGVNIATQSGRSIESLCGLHSFEAHRLQSSPSYRKPISDDERFGFPQAGNNQTMGLDIPALSSRVRVAKGFRDSFVGDFSSVDIECFSKRLGG